MKEIENEKDMEKKEEIILDLLDKWKSLTPFANFKHTCDISRCVYKLINIYYTPSHSCVVFKNQKRCFGEQPCPKAQDFWWCFKDIFACEVSGAMHWCGKKCTLVEMNEKDAQVMCPLSGITRFTHVLVDKFFKAGGPVNETTASTLECERQMHREHVKAVISATRQTRSHQRRMYMSNVSTKCIEEQTVQQWLFDLVGTETYDASYCQMVLGFERVIPKNITLQYFMAAASKIWSLFCKERYYGDQERIKNTQNILLNTVERTFSNAKNGTEVVVYTRVETEYNGRLTRLRAITPRLYKENPGDKEKRRVVGVIQEYAWRVIKMWYIIRTKTSIGRENPEYFPFMGFILPCIYLFMSGVTITKHYSQSDIIILLPDPRLRLWLPEEQTLCDIEKSKIQYSKIQSNMQQALTKAIIYENVAQNDLCIEKLTVNLMDSPFFTALRQSVPHKRKR